MKQQKKNSFFTLVFSFMPGAAEMYMGFMKNGLSLMGIFTLGFIIPVVLRVNDVFILPVIVVWFYGFFHARNLAACKEDIFQELTDVYIWEEFGQGRQLQIASHTLRKWAAVILIVSGAVVLWENVTGIIYRLIPNWMWDYLAPLIDSIPRIVTAILLIVIGIKMVMGKKEEYHGEGEQ